MSTIWVGHPGSQSPKSPKLLKSIEEQLGLFETIDSLGKESFCKICGSPGELTKEHTPSRAAFNRSKLINFSVAPIISKFLRWEGVFEQGGTKHRSLCRDCNNKTGAWYNPSYVKFVRACAPFAQAENAYKSINLSTNIFPTRVAKQALAHLVATCQPGLSIKFDGLREIILNKEKSLDISPLKIGMFIKLNKGGRQSGVTIFVDTIREKARLIAEFSFWPLGWIMTFDNSSFEGTLDVTEWCLIDSRNRINLKMDIPCQWCISPYPGDFRPPEKVLASDS